MDINDSMPELHAELRRMADWHMSKEKKYITMQRSALVNTAYLRLMDQENLKGANRSEFLSAAANIMRWILIEEARKRKNQKHGGDRKRVSVDDVDPPSRDPLDALSILSFNEVLEKLKGHDQRMHDVVVGRVFAGMTMDEIAESIGIAPRTAATIWAEAKKWLAIELKR